MPSLVELAALKLPPTRYWSDDSDQHIKSIVMKPQQKGYKRIIVSEIQNASRVEPVGDIEPLSENEIDILMEEAFDFDDLKKKKTLTNLLMLEGEVNVVYSTLKNLQKLPVGYQTRKIHQPSHRYFHSYADRRREAKENYSRSLRKNLQEVKDRIQAVKEKVQSEGGSFNFKRDFSFEDEQNIILYGSDAARAERQFLDRMALNEYNDLLADAESNRNDLYNYAKAVIVNYFHYNDRDWLMNDFGENNELYHEYEN